MITLSVKSIETAVEVAFNSWLDQSTEPVYLELEGHNVEITIKLHGDKFNCGIPGYNMSNSDIKELSKWVPKNIVKGDIEGELAPCKDQKVNVWLKGGTDVMFNFHVNLTDPC
jgi:hypothetical protein